MSTNSQTNSFKAATQKIKLQRGLVFGAIIIFALLAFELFNFSTTEFALKDLLGDLSFFGIFWSTILAVAFCGIDFAGIARLFTPERGQDEPKEVWYLFGAWLLAATMNAMLTWWGVSIAIVNNQTLGSAVIERETLLRFVPIFVALLVWLIRVLIIGTFSLAGDRLFTLADETTSRSSQPVTRNLSPSIPARAATATNHSASNPATFKPAPKSGANPAEAAHNRPEPTYSPLQASPPGGTSNRQISSEPMNASPANRNRQ